MSYHVQKDIQSVFVGICGSDISFLNAILLKMQGHKLNCLYFYSNRKIKHPDLLSFNYDPRIKELAKKMDIAIKEVDCSEEIQQRILKYSIEKALEDELFDYKVHKIKFIYDKLYEYSNSINSSSISLGLYCKTLNTGGKIFIASHKDNFLDDSRGFALVDDIERLVLPLGDLSAVETKSYLEKLKIDSFSNKKELIEEEIESFCSNGRILYLSSLIFQNAIDRTKPLRVSFNYGENKALSNALLYFTTKSSCVLELDDKVSISKGEVLSIYLSKAGQNLLILSGQLERISSQVDEYEQRASF